MSKMGEELERRLDEAKYKVYEAIKSAIAEIEDKAPDHARTILIEAIREVE